MLIGMAEMADLAISPHWKARAYTLIVMLIEFQIALFGMHSTQLPPHPMALPDIGHRLIPAIHHWFGSTSGYVWWLGSISEELYAVIAMLFILITGKGCRLGIAFATVAVCHALFWHFTLLPAPPDILWQFPLITGQVPMPNDFWFSGHIGSSFLLVLYSQGKKWWLRGLAFLYFIFMVWLVLATRTHYSIDIIGGMFVAYGIYTLVNKYWTWI